MKNALDDCLSFNCQLGILHTARRESQGWSVSIWLALADKTMKNNISIAGLR